MIYGEEIVNLPFDKGLWLSDDLDAVPDGYCANLVNLVKTPGGSLELRPNFLPTTNFNTSLNFTLSNLDTLFPLSKGNAAIDYTSRNSANFSAFSLSPIGTIDCPILTIFSRTAAGATTAHSYLNNNTVVNTGLGGGVTTIPNKIVQYRDRYYVIEKNNTYFDTVHNYVFSAGLISRNLLVTLPRGLIDIVPFKDRLFAFSCDTSRVYYTEQAASGGYPENWNSGNNFFDLPDSGALVRRAFVLNDRLYLFTNIGVYHLYANGVPSNWQINFITDKVKVLFHDDINVINGVFVYTDRKTVYIYNGSTTLTEIGRPISAAFYPQVRDYAIPLETSVQTYDGPTGFKFFPYLDGFLFACYHYVNGMLGSLVADKVNKYYYFDGDVWSEVQFDIDLSGSNRGHYDLLLTSQRQNLKTVGSDIYRPDEILIELRYNSNTTQVITAAKVIRKDNSDIDIGNFQTNFGLFTKDYEFRNPNITRIKELRANFKTSLSTFTISPYVDGVYSNTHSPSLTTTGQFKQRVPVSIQRGNSLAISISGSLVKTAGPGGDQSLHVYPSFRLNSLSAFINSDTRKTVDQTYAT